MKKISKSNIINDLTKEYQNKISENENLKDQINNIQKQIQTQKANNINNINNVNVIKTNGKRHIKIDLDNNDIYNFVQNDLNGLCLYKKGIDGQVEQYEGKDDKDIFNRNINLKKIIKIIIKMI